jgi:cytochrome oxidase Cu insertion factor (SCO1/SenC/PrrC family)
MSTDAQSTDASATPVLPVVDRAAAFQAGAAKVPRKFLYFALAAIAVLGLGGSALEHALSAAGLNPVAKPVPKTHTPAIKSGLPAFMGLIKLPPSQAPGFSLTTASGRALALSAEHGKVVVLTFFDARCADICPIVASEIARADADLGSASTHVVFLTINTNPLHTGVSPTSPAGVRTGLWHLANWHMLGGSLAALDAVWRNYGVTINVSRTTGAIAHNDIVYFIDPRGMIRLRATPFANESAAGAFSLGRASILRWGDGVATYARSLLPAGS